MIQHAPNNAPPPPPPSNPSDQEDDRITLAREADEIIEEDAALMPLPIQ